MSITRKEVWCVLCVGVVWLVLVCVVVCGGCCVVVVSVAGCCVVAACLLLSGGLSSLRSWLCQCCRMWRENKLTVI